jgi:hypothetical protein
MKISGIDWMKNFQDSKTVQDSKIEKVRANTSIAKESSWLDKPAKLFFKNSKIAYKMIDFCIIVAVVLSIILLIKQNNRLAIYDILIVFILGVVRYKIGIFGYWYSNKDLPIFDKERIGNDRTNLVWYNVFPKTKEVQKPSKKEREVFEYLRKINNQVNKKVLEFYLFSIMGMFTFFAFMAIVIAKYYPTIAGVIVFSAITLLCVTLGLSANKRDISSLAENNFNVKMRAITFDKGVIIKVSFYVKTSYQIDDVIETSKPYEIVKILQKFT